MIGVISEMLTSRTDSTSALITFLCRLVRLKSPSISRLRIRAYLGSHGYAAAAVNAALGNISPKDWREGCITLLERKYTPWPTDADGQKKAYAALGRMGYTADEVKTALRCRKSEDML